MNLFEECLEALGKNAKISEENIVDKVLDNFDTHFPLTAWGRIDWKDVENKYSVSSLEEIIPTLKAKLKDPSKPIFIIGSDPTVPILESKLDKVLEVFDDVEAVNPITWFFCPSDGWVVQIDDDGTITIGLI